MQDVIQPFDLQRMFFGMQPPLFYLEIAVRTLVIYAWGLLLLRWLGSRTIGQLSTVEFLLVIALGSAVGDPMFYPDVPVFYGMAVITVVDDEPMCRQITVPVSTQAARNGSQWSLCQLGWPSFSGFSEKVTAWHPFSAMRRTSSACSSNPAICSSVDWPVPDGATSATDCPSHSARLAPSRMVRVASPCL